jgi:hypothetical protein
MNTAGEKRKAEEAVLQLARPRKVVVVAAATTAKMDPRLLESSTEELNDELARLETQRLELKSALREIKFKMGEIRRLVGARNAAQHMEDFHLQTTIQGSLISPPSVLFNDAFHLIWDLIARRAATRRGHDLGRAAGLPGCWATSALRSDPGDLQLPTRRRPSQGLNGAQPTPSPPTLAHSSNAVV